MAAWQEGTLCRRHGHYRLNYQTWVSDSFTGLILLHYYVVFVRTWACPELQQACITHAAHFNCYS